MSVQVFQDNMCVCVLNEVFANGRRLFSVFSHSLVQVPESWIQQELKVHEIKPPTVNQQCDLCDASYVGYTLTHMHQHMAEH